MKLIAGGIGLCFGRLLGNRFLTLLRYRGSDSLKMEENRNGNRIDGIHDVRRFW